MTNGDNFVADWSRIITLAQPEGRGTGEFGGSDLMASRSYLIGLIGGLVFAIVMTQLAFSESIKLKQSGGVYMVPVRINDTVTVPFVLDIAAPLKYRSPMMSFPFFDVLTR